ncbi:MAG: hypothetical protein ACLQFR_17575 [Streptosporangiaceae bacterium]
MEDPAEAPTDPASSHGPPAPRAQDPSSAIVSVGDVLFVRGVRLTDDPEILERVLAGLLNLP